MGVGRRKIWDSSERRSGSVSCDGDAGVTRRKVNYQRDPRGRKKTVFVSRKDVSQPFLSYVIACGTYPQRGRHEACKQRMRRWVPSGEAKQETPLFFRPCSIQIIHAVHEKIDTMFLVSRRTHSFMSIRLCLSRIRLTLDDVMRTCCPNGPTSGKNGKLRERVSISS